MIEIPEKAEPVVEILRRDVVKPDPFELEGGLAKKSARWNHAACPMGLHAKSTIGVPESNEEFAGGICKQSSVSAFFLWWDGLDLDDARAAVDLIWPEEKKKP